MRLNVLVVLAILIHFYGIDAFYPASISLTPNLLLTTTTNNQKVQKQQLISRHYLLRMSAGENDNNSAAKIDDDSMEFDNSYRIESVKSGLFGAIGGSVGSLPIAVLIGYFQHFNAQWELSHDALALSLFLFGVTYRYAVRGDVNNKQLQFGVIGAFAVVRALNMVDVSSYCTSLPLNCGPPFFYFDIPMISIGLVNFFESLLAFGTAAAALEWAFKSKFLTRC